MNLHPLAGSESGGRNCPFIPGQTAPQKRRWEPYNSHQNPEGVLPSTPYFSSALAKQFRRASRRRGGAIRDLLLPLQCVQCVLADRLEALALAPCHITLGFTARKPDCYPSRETWHWPGLLMDEVLAGIRFQDREASSTVRISSGKEGPSAVSRFHFQQLFLRLPSHQHVRIHRSPSRCVMNEASRVFTSPTAGSELNIEAEPGFFQPCKLPF